MQSSPNMQGFRLPENPDPPLICVQLKIPNEPAHIAAFLGVLYDLTLWNSWQRDTAHRAIVAAQLWKRIWIDLVNTPLGCPQTDFGVSIEASMADQIRINPDDMCIIQMWCIDHWENWYDPRSCIASGAVQPGPGGPITSGDCKSQALSVHANSQLIIPFALKEGNVVTASNLAGGVWDGDVLHSWQCPDGSVYALGACGATGPANASGPMPTLPYGRLLLLVNGVYYDLAGGPVVLPVGMPDSDGYLQINDTVLGDNQGSFSLTLSVCNESVPTYDRLVDFTTATNGFVNYPADEGPGCNPTLTPYAPGVGWSLYDCAGIGASFIEIINSPFAATTIEDIKLTFTTDDTSLTASDAEVFLELSGGETLVGTLATPWSSTNDLHISGSWVATGIRIRIGVASLTANVIATSLELQGPGIAPF